MARGNSVKLKPGQVWSQDDHTIKDTYQTKHVNNQKDGIVDKLKDATTEEADISIPADQGSE